MFLSSGQGNWVVPKEVRLGEATWGIVHITIYIWGFENFPATANYKNVLNNSNIEQAWLKS